MVTSLVIRALSLNEKPLSQPIKGVFDEKGGSIGRADTNTMALPDPERMISRLHARVTWDKGAFWIQDVGHGVGSLLNGRPIATGGAARLKPHDELRIGGYRLLVDDLDEEAAGLVRQRTITERSVLRAEPGAGEAAPPAQVPARQRPADPFADLLGPSAAPLAPERAGFGGPSAAAAAAPGVPDPFSDLLGPIGGSGPGAEPKRDAHAGPAPARLPDDFNPFAGAEPAPAAAPQADDPFAMVGDPSNQPGAIDKAFGLVSAPGKDPLADFIAPPAAGHAAQIDPLQALAQAPAVAPLPASADHTPELNAAYAPPRIVEAVRPKAQAPAAEPPPAAPHPTDASVTELWHQFLEGAGLPQNFPQPPTPFLMRVVGSVLREMTEGILQLLAARAAGKNQLRAEMTLIQARNNNPLKFTPNARAALSQLLQPPAAGFLTAPDAVRDAMSDLRTHQLGTMTAMGAALESVLARFDPRSLQDQLGDAGAIDALLPPLRAAKLWQLYLRHFQAIRGEGGENLQQLFSRAFVAAYEEQVERLERGQPAGRH